MDYTKAPGENLVNWLIDGVSLSKETKSWLREVGDISESLSLQLILDAKIKFNTLMRTMDTTTPMPPLEETISKNITILRTDFPKKAQQLEKLFSITVNENMSLGI